MPKPRDWDRNTVEHARDALKRAENPANERISTRHAIGELSDVIREKLSEGWSRQEIVEFLADLGVEIPLGTLRTYLSAAERPGRAPEAAAPQPSTAARSQSQKKSSKRPSGSKSRKRSTAKSGDTTRSGIAASPQFLGHEDV